VADLVAGHVYVAPFGTEPGGDGWADIGESFGGVSPQLPVGEPAWQPWTGGDITLSITVDVRDALRTLSLLTGFTRRLIHEQACTGSYSRCRTCHPEQAPRPLAVDGREYHRRQRARQRRRRHGH
jgi:hypothetical protein